MGRLRYISPTYTGDSLEAVNQLTGALSTGLAGQGLAPDIRDREFAERRRILGEQYGTERRGLESSLSRTVAGADVGLKQYYRDFLKSKYAGSMDDLRRERSVSGFEDIGAAQNLALGFLGGEIGMAGGMSNIANQAAMNKMNMPSYGSELAEGLGGATGIGLAGMMRPQQSYADFPATTNPAGFTGSQYARNWAPSQYTSPSISPLIKYAQGMSSPYSPNWGGGN